MTSSGSAAPATSQSLSSTAMTTDTSSSVMAVSSFATGATLATATSIDETLLTAPSESSTCTLMAVVFGPSRNVTSKLPDPVAASNVTFEIAASGAAVAPPR